MSKSILLLMCAICLGLGIAGSNLVRADDAQPATQPVDPKPVNTKCLVSGEDIDAAKTIVYKGKTIAFCCEDCEKSFNKDPEKYVAKMK